MDMRRIHTVLEDEPDLELAVLIGSQCDGTATSGSDWDFAVQWRQQSEFTTILAATERLRHRLAGAIGVPSDRIDLIDLPSARLAIRAVVAEEGCLLQGDGSLAWSHFLIRTWRELEDWAWEAEHAAWFVPAGDRAHCGRAGVPV